MRPDRIVVGEVRGAEVVELLAALNTGHDGGCGTVHASAAAALPARLEALALAAGLPRAGAAQPAGGRPAGRACTSSGPGGAGRVVREIGCLDRGADGLARVVPALRVDVDGRLVEGPAAGALSTLLDGSGDRVTGGCARLPLSAWPRPPAPLLPADPARPAAPGADRGRPHRRVGTRSRARGGRVPVAAALLGWSVAGSVVLGAAAGGRDPGRDPDRRGSTGPPSRGRTVGPPRSTW